MAKNKKREELLKANRRNYKEINRRNAVCVIAKESLPSLQRPISSRYHVLRDCRLSDVEAELEKLTVDVRRTPERILETHSSNKVAHLFVDLRSAAAGTGFPPPERTEAFVMAYSDCFFVIGLSLLLCTLALFLVPKPTAGAELSDARKSGRPFAAPPHHTSARISDARGRKAGGLDAEARNSVRMSNRPSLIALRGKKRPKVGPRITRKATPPGRP